MKHAKFIFMSLTGILLLFAVACGQKSKSDEGEDLQKRVEAIHDETMAKIGTIRDYQDRAEKLLDKLKAESEDPASLKMQTVTGVLDKLNEADEAMMDWMRNYNPNSEEMSKEERAEYLRSEMQKIVAVQNKISEAEMMAKGLFKKEWASE